MAKTQDSDVDDPGVNLCSIMTDTRGANCPGQRLSRAAAGRRTPPLCGVTVLFGRMSSLSVPQITVEHHGVLSLSVSSSGRTAAARVQIGLPDGAPA